MSLSRERQMIVNLAELPLWLAAGTPPRCGLGPPASSAVLVELFCFVFVSSCQHPHLQRTPVFHTMLEFSLPYKQTYYLHDLSYIYDHR
ncbi:hypothetical protein AWENTII_000719 [Aspergillus wentii]